MFAYLVLLFDPSPHPLLCVEEPENRLYPKLLEELAEEFRENANRCGQVFVSTHSPDFLNATRVEEVYWLSKNDGFTHVQRAIDDAQIVAYMSDGDRMGYLWKEGLFGWRSILNEHDRILPGGTISMGNTTSVAP